MVTRAQQDAFVNEFSGLAAEGSRLTGFSPELVLSQMGLESRWGDSQLMRDNFNLSGIEKGTWPGATFTSGGRTYRSYSSYKEFMQDWSNRKAVRDARAALAKSGIKNPTIAQQAQALKSAKYAEKPTYARDLTNTVKSMTRNHPDVVTGMRGQARDTPVERNIAGMEASRQPYSDFGHYGTPRESLAQPFSGRQVNADYQDYTDVLANEQLGVPDLPGPLQGMPAERSLQGLGDWSTGLAYDNLAPNPPDYSDITKGITHGGTPYGFTDAVTSSMEPSMAVYDGGPYGYGQQPDYSSITEGIMHDAYPSNPYGSEALGAPQTFGNYGNAPLGYSPDTFSGAPMQTQPATPDVFSSQPLGAPQAFGNYGAGEIGYPSGGFASKPSTATDMSLAGLSPVGQGVVGVGYNPSVVAAASPIGAPAARGMSFDQMTRGIVGYEDKPVTTTTQVANPAWSEWSKDFTKNNALQEAYLNDEMDRHGPAKPTNVPNYEWSPEPARTVSRTTTTTQRSPVYGDVPVGQPIGANLSQAGAGSWTSGLTNQANTIGAQINDFSNFGLEGFTGNFGTGIGDPSGGMSLGGLGGVGGGFSGALGGSYGPGGQPLGGSENQGGAGYGGSFSGSQGSDPSGRGGLY